MSEEKKSDIQNLDNALELMNFSKESLNEMFDKIESTISSTKKDLLALEEEKSKLEKIKKEQEQKISGLNDEQQKLLDEYEQIKGELEKFTKTASGGEAMDVGNIRDTLAIYRILLEKIWDAAPHYKVLKLLHVDEKPKTIEQLKNSSGFGGAILLHACHELAKVDLIQFDIDTKTASLIKRLFPKGKGHM